MRKPIQHDWITVREAAAIIGCSDGRVKQLIQDGSLTGQKFGIRVWQVDRKSAEIYRDYKPSTGRPRGSKQTRPDK